MGPRAAKRCPRVPKSGPRAARSDPKVPKSDPRTAPEQPKEFQEADIRHQKYPKRQRKKPHTSERISTASTHQNEGIRATRARSIYIYIYIGPGGGGAGAEEYYILKPY